MSIKRLLIISILLFAGCSNGGGSTPTSPSTAPAISNMQYSPATVAQGTGGGATTVTGNFDFIDNEGDVTTMRITSSGGGNLTTALSNMAGVTAGKVGFVVIGIDTTIKASYTFQLWVIDSNGNSSNTLSGAFTVN